MAGPEGQRNSDDDGQPDLHQMLRELVQDLEERTVRRTLLDHPA